MNSVLDLTNLSSGVFQINLTGVDWQRYVLLGSTNLLNWYTNTAAITMANGVHSYTNSLNGTKEPLGNEFYRAVLVP
jgi:hypothetical protein